MESNSGKFVLHWEKQSSFVNRGLCMLLERQCLVDVAISCGSNTLHAHKVVLAANSSYFKEHFENKGIEQVIIGGIDFAVLKALIEFMYCGECIVNNDFLKHFIAAARFFKVTILDTIFAEPEYQNIPVDEVSIPPPQFICKSPKYPTVYKPFSNAMMPPKLNYAITNAYGSSKFKRKSLGNEAERACVKEAQASHIALANLRKVMETTPQLHSFIVEENFNETTVENFLPNVDENFESVDVQFVNETDRPDGRQNAADKMKQILSSDGVQIMFETTSGKLVNVSNDISKSSFEYQIVAENHFDDVVLAEEQPVSSDEEDGCYETKVPKSANLRPKMQNGPFIDSSFSGKSDDSIQGNVNEDIYMQNAEIFEPQNLSIHSELLSHNAMEFEAVNGINYKILASQMDTLKHNNSTNYGTNATEDLIIIKDETPIPSESIPKSTLKFSPDMFFTEPPKDVLKME